MADKDRQKMVDKNRFKNGLKVYGSTMPEVAEPTKTSTTVAYDEAQGAGTPTVAQAYGNPVTVAEETPTAPTGGSQKEVEAAYTSAFNNALTKSVYDIYNNRRDAHYTTAEKKLEDAYNTAITKLKAQEKAEREAIVKKANSAQQAASVSLDKLKKYLPTQIRRQGLDGLGVSETAALRANNAYVTQMGNIAAETGDSMAELASRYASQRASLASGHESELLSLYRDRASAVENDKLLAYQSADKADADQKAMWDANYRDAEAKLAEGYFSTQAEAQAFVDGLDVSDEQRKQLQATVNSLGETLSNSETNIVQSPSVVGDSSNASFEEGKKISVSIGGKGKKLKSGGAVYDTEIMEAAKSVNANAVFGHDGLLYYKTGGGVIIALEENAEDYAEIFAAIYGQ
jgi:hypothetical protein